MMILWIKKRITEVFSWSSTTSRFLWGLLSLTLRTIPLNSMSPSRHWDVWLNVNSSSDGSTAISNVRLVLMCTKCGNIYFKSSLFVLSSFRAALKLFWWLVVTQDLKTLFNFL